MAALFGEKLRSLRVHLGMTQHEAASNLGLARPGYISNLETGKKEPSLELVVKVAIAFRVTTDYLLRDTEPLQSSNPPAVVHHLYDIQKVGSNLLTLRKAAGLTQTDVARATFLSKPGYISNIEKGVKYPSITLIKHLATFFNTSTDFFFL